MKSFVHGESLIRRLMGSTQVATEQDALRLLASGAVALKAVGDPDWITVGPDAAHLELHTAGQIRIGDAEVLDVVGHRPSEASRQLEGRPTPGGA